MKVTEQPKSNASKHSKEWNIPGFFYQPFISYFTPIILKGTILDLGCGKGINGFLIRLSRYLIKA